MNSIRIIRIRSIRSSVEVPSALSFAVLPGLPSSVNPAARDVAERAGDQNSDQWGLADLPRNGTGRTTTRIDDVLRHSARLRPSLLCGFARIVQHFFRPAGHLRRWQPWRSARARRLPLRPLSRAPPCFLHRPKNYRSSSSSVRQRSAPPTTKGAAARSASTVIVPLFSFNRDGLQHGRADGGLAPKRRPAAMPSGRGENQPDQRRKGLRGLINQSRDHVWRQPARRPDCRYENPRRSGQGAAGLAKNASASAVPVTRERSSYSKTGAAS